MHARRFPCPHLAASLALALMALAHPLLAQNAPAPGKTAAPAAPKAQSGSKAASRRHVGLVDDWTTHTLVFSNPQALEHSASSADRQRWNRIVHEPRYLMQQIKRNRPAPSEAIDSLAQIEAAHGRPDISTLPPPAPRLPRDWSISLGGAGVTNFIFPSGYIVDNTTPDCTQNYVVYPVGRAGASNQANLIGVNNLYVNPSATGFCSGTAPKILFSYFVGSGVVQTSPETSLEGDKVAYVESIAGGSKFHVLTIGTTGNNGSSATAPAVPGTGNNAVDQAIVINGNVMVTRSDVYVDFVNDNAYLGDDNGFLHLFHPVFYGTPAEVTTGGWPIAVSTASSILSGPTLDIGSQNILIGESLNGSLYYVMLADSTTGFCYNGGAPPCLGGYTSGSSTLAALPVGNGTTGHPYGAIYDPPLIDGTTGHVFVGTGSAVTAYCSAQNTMVLETDSAFTNGTVEYFCLGLGNLQNIHDGQFDNAYFSNPASGHLYWAAHDAAQDLPVIWYMGFNASGIMTSATEATNLILASTVNPPSPLTEVYDPFTGNDWLDFTQKTASCGGSTGGCTMAININNVPLAGGTYGPWLPNTNYALSHEVIDTNGNVQEVTTAGTSGAPTPAWATSGTTTDGTDAYATATGAFSANTAVAGDTVHINGFQLTAATPTAATATATFVDSPDTSAVTITDGSNVLSLATNATAASVTGTFAAEPTSSSTPTITITNSSESTGANTLTLTTNAVAATATGTISGTPVNGQTATVGGTDVATASAELYATGAEVFAGSVAAGKTVTITCPTPQCGTANTLTLTSATPTQAIGTVTFQTDPNAWPAGETVTIAGTTYTFVTSVGTTANQVLICNTTCGTTVAQRENRTAENLRAAVNATAGQCYASPCFGSSTVANANVTATWTAGTSVTNLTAAPPGTLGNFTESTNYATGMAVAETNGNDMNTCPSPYTTGTFGATSTNTTYEATNLAAAISLCTASTTGVTATSSGATVTIQALTIGAGGNTITTATNAGNLTLSGANLAGGNTVNNTPPSFAVTNAGGAALSNATIAANLMAALVPGAAAAGVGVTSSGAVVTVTAAALGTGGNATTLASTLSNFTWSGTKLAGGSNGSDGCPTSPTSGTFSVGDQTPGGSANQITMAINDCNTSYPVVGVTATRSGATVTLTANKPGPFLAVGATNNTGVFTWGALSGGSAGSNTCNSATTGTYATSSNTTTLATNFKDAINKCPATVGVKAAVSGGVVTVTALTAGTDGNNIALGPSPSPSFFDWSAGLLSGGTDGSTTGTQFQIWQGSANESAGQIATNLAQAINTNAAAIGGVMAVYSGSTSCTSACDVVVTATNYGAQYDYAIASHLTGFAWNHTELEGGKSPVIWTEQGRGNGEATIAQPVGASATIADNVFFPAWQSATSYALGTRISDDLGYVEMVTTAGTSGGTTPNWCGGIPAPGCNTTDGSVVWTNQGQQPTANLYLGTLTGTGGDTGVKYTQAGLQ